MNKRTEDITLINSALQGNQRAFKDLYSKYKYSIFTVCLRYAKDRSTAQDYLQDTFVTIFNKLNQFDATKGAFESWAKRIAINSCLMDIRKNALHAVGTNGLEQIQSDAIDIFSKLSLKELLEVIQQLPQGYRTVFNMYVIDGFSHKEIAEHLNVSINTSKSQLRKARCLLQKKILENKKIYRQLHG